MSENAIILELLESMLGDPKNHNPYKGQISFDCPVCSYDIKGLDCGDGKGNLEINYKRNIFKCWACSDTHYTKGHLGKLVKKWGNPSHNRLFELTNPEDGQTLQNKTYTIPKLPRNFIKISDGNPLSIPHKEAVNYLKRRGVTQQIIEKYNLGYVLDGEYRYRIIVPSYDQEGELNYFVGRSFIKTKLKYKNPEYPKDKIIFNEPLINWEEDIYLVEGVFDMFFLPNSIPILGKVISDNLWKKLYDKAKGKIIICLDSDAWDNAEKLYFKLNGGNLRGRIRVVKMPDGKDVGDIRGDINKKMILNLER